MKFLNKINSNVWVSPFKKFLILYILFSPVFSQSTPLNEDWTFDGDVNGVVYYHMLKDCNGKKVVFLKFENKNTYPVKISWNEIFTTQEGPGIEGYFGRKNIIIPTGEKSETNCTEPFTKELVILPQQVAPTYLADISKFEFKDIKITKA